MFADMFVKVLHTALLVSCFFTMVQGQPLTSSDIRFNQVGFYPYGSKIAVVLDTGVHDFYITAVDGKNKVFVGKLVGPFQSEYSPRKTMVADFTSFEVPGRYTIVVPGRGVSAPFDIRDHVMENIAKASIKAFYYQRHSVDLPERYAGRWHRAAGHPDTKVLVHASAASPQRPTGFVIGASRGWYDAGDYNKYVVNSGITMGTLFSAYEDFSQYFDTLALDIPERANAVPDLLDEVLWNLRWMLAMQDPGDGGVYHKLTNAAFDGMIMPDKANTPRYVVQKGTAATLNFAAVMAQAARVYKKYDNVFPGLSDSCNAAAHKAWQWAVKSPNVVYHQEALNRQFDPDITTGGYGDRDFLDEFIWAAAELYITTKNPDYLKSVRIRPDGKMLLPSWNQVRLLGYYSLIRFQDRLDPVFQDDLTRVKKDLITFADDMARDILQRPYRTVMGKSPRDFIWGSNAVAANQGIVMVQAYRLAKDKRYMDYALSNLDYLLGRNATGYSFVTGYGYKTPMHPHHRPSIADGVAEPVPGMLVGGPNPGKQDQCTSYTSSIADEAYTDDDCSYASNEIAINWNAPLVYLVCALEALQQRTAINDTK